ncbi:MAG: nicotinate-nucleotide--dimethylbenzimidazole phosphoribosyltransferase [Maricaulaceae bacterium]
MAQTDDADLLTVSGHPRDPLDDVRDLVARAPGPDLAARAAARDREARLAKPPGGLGRLETIVEWLSAWQGRHPPKADRLATVVFAASHGVAGRDVSVHSDNDTARIARYIADGQAAVNAFAKACGSGLKLYDLALDQPTPDICDAPALSPRDCAATIAFGMEALVERPEVLCVGVLGVGSTTVAAAVACGLYGGQPAFWARAGSGISGRVFVNKVDAINAALVRHRGALTDPLEVLRRLGGRDIAAAIGAILAARHQRTPVILDGFAATAAAAELHEMRSDVIDHCLAGHVTPKPSHAALLERIRKKPLLDLGAGLGDGSGAALAAGVVRAAAMAHRDMALREDDLKTPPE